MQFTFREGGNSVQNLEFIIGCKLKFCGCKKKIAIAKQVWVSFQLATWQGLVGPAQVSNLKINQFNSSHK